MLTPEELAMFHVLSSPTKWAKVYLDWTARWYQEQYIEDNHNRIVIRAGRRVGKTDGIIVKILNRAFTKPGRGENESYVVLILTPFESQIDVIFKRLRELINQSAELKASIKREIHNPEEIEFHNGARIVGYTTGARSGSGAANIRGQRADLIYLDEMDYMADADINTIVAILLEDPDRIELIATSTPSGRRSHFYNWCTNPDMGFHTYHFPASVNPTWTTATEELFRSTMSELAYLQEIEAEFGEEQAGVFQKKYLDRAKEIGKELELSYHKRAFDRRGPRILACDWDKYGASTNMLGMEWVPEFGLFVPIYKMEIPRTQFTLDNAVSKIIESNSIFDWDFIYLDKGYGEYQIETLHKYGMTHPASGLTRKIQAISFSDKIEVRDPYTKQKEKKDIKPFMVNNAVMYLEREQVALVPTDKQLIEQLENYRVEKIGLNGRPVYTDENEHLVDCFCMCLYGMTMHFSDIMKLQLAKRMAGLPSLSPNDDVRSRDMQPKPKKQPLIPGAAYVSVPMGGRGGSSGRAAMGMPRRKSF